MTFFQSSLICLFHYLKNFHLLICVTVLFELTDDQFSSWLDRTVITYKQYIYIQWQMVHVCIFIWPCTKTKGSS